MHLYFVQQRSNSLYTAFKYNFLNSFDLTFLRKYFSRSNLLIHWPGASRWGVTPRRCCCRRCKPARWWWWWWRSAQCVCTLSANHRLTCCTKPQNNSSLEDGSHHAFHPISYLISSHPNWTELNWTKYAVRVSSVHFRGGTMRWVVAVNAP